MTGPACRRTNEQAMQGDLGGLTAVRKQRQKEFLYIHSKVPHAVSLCSLCNPEHFSCCGILEPRSCNRVLLFAAGAQTFQYLGPAKHIQGAVQIGATGETPADVRSC